MLKEYAHLVLRIISKKIHFYNFICILFLICALFWFCHWKSNFVCNSLFHYSLRIFPLEVCRFSYKSKAFAIMDWLEAYKGEIFMNLQLDSIIIQSKFKSFTPSKSWKRLSSWTQKSSMFKAWKILHSHSLYIKILIIFWAFIISSANYSCNRFWCRSGQTFSETLN